VEVLVPEYVAERSEITMSYVDQRKNTLGLSSSGRGLQQTLLLLVHLYANPAAVLLLDEPDGRIDFERLKLALGLAMADSA
jgi:ATPase subunit of ABC transporter with duplicated ATPase domains